MDSCHLCQSLKKELSDIGVEYEEKNLKDRTTQIEFNKLSTHTQSDKVPVCIINNKILLPERSFRSIEECVNLIKKYGEDK